MLRPCTLRWPAAPALSAPCPLAPPRPRRVVSRPRTETAAMPLDTRRAPRFSTQAASNVHPLFANTHDGFDPDQNSTMTLLL